MKQEEKSTLARQRILNAAMQEFAQNGYDGASLNTVCTENNISKGIIYHHFKDKDDIYLQCVEECFYKLTVHLRDVADGLSGTVEQKLNGYLDARFLFFVENPLYSGIFADAALRPPVALAKEIADCRREFDALNIEVLTGLLNSKPLRAGLSVTSIVEDFRHYMDYFNMRFKADFCDNYPIESVLREHEERCHRQINTLLYGVFGERDE